MRALVFLSLLLASAQSVFAQQVGAPENSIFKQALDSIVMLESQRDPKCYATASRLEDFMYGTPLTDEARNAKIELQKDLVRHIWKRADTLAHVSNRDTIDNEILNSALTPIWKSIARDDQSWVILTREGQTIRLTHRDVRQYASVAYSLRSILAYQQEQPLFSADSLRALDEETFAKLREFIDLYSLASLQIADREARAADRYTVDAPTLRAAWASLGIAARTTADTTLRVAQPDSLSALIHQIIENKIASYEAYNQISLPVFMRNIQVYFARHRWPTEQQESESLKSYYTEVMIEYSAQLLAEAERIAIGNQHTLIRVGDVQAAAQRITPHTTNNFEDVTFFPRLPRQERITIDSFDLDAFRDGGLHWQYLRGALKEPDFDGTIEPDPFALELLSESIAQFGVLFLRVSGQSVEGPSTTSLERTHMEGAVKTILARINTHTTREPTLVQQTILASAPDSGATQGRVKPFTDITDGSGIDFAHRSSDWLNRLIRSYSIRDSEVVVIDVPPAFGGSGAAAEDINGDGLPDLLLLSGSGNKLLLNDGEGGFKDITQQAGIDWRRSDGLPGEPRQPLIADLDNDGLQDIVITYVNDPHRVYRNLGNAQFEDVTDRAGLGGAGLVGGPATVVDIDNDGLLDLYITYFGQYIDGILPTLSRRNENGLPNRLFRNLGGMKFEDITEKSGIAGSGWTQAAAHTDINLDGWQDLIEGNDFGINAYYLNQGDGTFINAAQALNTDKPSYTMSIGIADLNADQYPDFYISNIVTMDKDQKYVDPKGETTMKFDSRTLADLRVVEANDLFVSVQRDGSPATYEQSTAIGRGKSSTGWAWGADFLDFDNDGDDDLYVANGMNEFAVYSSENPYYRDPKGEARSVRFPESTRETNVLFRNESGKLVNFSENSGADLYGNSRAVVYVDFDIDGDLDMLLNNYHEPAVLLQNNAEKNGNHWISITLVGDPDQGVNRDAIGAILLMSTDQNQTIWREIHGGSGYLTMNPKRQHFGIGSANTASIKIIWPNSTTTDFSNLKANTSYRIDQRQNALVPNP